MPTQRTNIDLASGRSKLASVRSQQFARPTPNITADNRGILATGQVFQNFFGQLAGVADGWAEDMVDAAVDEATVERTVQAQKDFATGEGPDPELQDSKSYQRTFFTLVGEREGTRAWGDLENHLSQLPLEADIQSEATEWIKNEVGGGLSSPFATSTMMDVVQKNLVGYTKARQVALADERVSKLRGTINNSISEVVESGREVTPEDYQNWVELIQNADPANASSARATAMGFILSASDGSPDTLMMASRLMQEPGTGIDGASFAQSFPDKFDELDAKAVSARLNGITFEALEAYNGIENSLAQAKSLDELANLSTQLDDAASRYNGTNRIDALRSSLNKKADALLEAQVGYNNMATYVEGSADPNTAMKWTDVDEYHPELVTNQGGSFLTDDPEARRVAVMLSRNVPGLAKSTQDALGNAIMSSDPQSSLQAYLYIKDLNEVSGAPMDETLQKALSGSGNAGSRALIKKIWESDRISGQNPAKLLELHAQNRDFDLSSFTLAQATEDEDVDNVNSIFVDGLDDVFDPGLFNGIDTIESDMVAPEVMRLLQKQLRFVRGISPTGSWEDDAKRVVDSAIPELSLQVRNGKPYVSLGRQAKALVTNSAGEQEFRSIAPLSVNALNPFTGRVEDTWAAAQESLGSVADTMGLDFDDVSVGNLNVTRGYYPVMFESMPASFELGTTTYLPDGSTLELPSNPVQAAEAISSKFGNPKGVSVAENFTIVNGRPVVSLEMVYRPLFQTTGEFLDEVEANRASNPSDDFDERMDELGKYNEVLPEDYHDKQREKRRINEETHDLHRKSYQDNGPDLGSYK